MVPLLAELEAGIQLVGGLDNSVRWVWIAWMNWGGTWNCSINMASISWCGSFPRPLQRHRDEHSHDLHYASSASRDLRQHDGRRKRSAGLSVACGRSALRSHRFEMDFIPRSRNFSTSPFTIRLGKLTLQMKGLCKRLHRRGVIFPRIFDGKDSAHADDGKLAA